MNSILVLATAQSWFLAALVASRRSRRLADAVLVVWLTLMGLHTGIYHLLGQGRLELPWLASLNSAFPFLQGPLLFLYVDTLTRAGRRLRPSDLAHLLPAAAFVTYQWWALPSLVPPTGSRTLHIFSVSGVFTAALLLSVPAYVACSLLRIRSYRRQLVEAVSTADRIDLGWLRTLVAGLGGVWMVVLATFLARASAGGGSPQLPSHAIFWALALFVYAIGYQAFRHRAFVPEPVATILDTGASPGVRYRKSGLPEAEATVLLERLRRLMETERPYLDPALDLPTLAAALDASPNKVSQVLNGYEGKSFFDFVNGYRVASVKERLADSDEPRPNLLDLAFACGFRSKATFTASSNSTRARAQATEAAATREGATQRQASGRASPHTATAAGFAS